MDAPDARPRPNRLRAWWGSLSTRARERVLLGALVGAGVAARDLVLLGYSAAALAALELADHLAAPAPTAA